MVARVYKHLAGMELEFVSARLDENVSEKTIGYSAKFKLSLDFLNFKVAANQHIPNFLNNPLNAIRPELDGLAYHYSYNYLFDAAGNIRDNQALFALFTSPGYYMDQWAEGAGLELRYGKPVFEVVGSKLRVTARQDLRLPDASRHIGIADLPNIHFQWALNLLEGDSAVRAGKAPETRVVLMYAHEDLVEVDGQQMFRGARYINGKQLTFGEITPKQVLTAA